MRGGVSSHLGAPRDLPWENLENCGAGAAFLSLFF